jgi:hypothetical protein
MAAEITPLSTEAILRQIEALSQRLSTWTWTAPNVTVTYNFAATTTPGTLATGTYWAGTATSNYYPNLNYELTNPVPYPHRPATNRFRERTPEEIEAQRQQMRRETEQRERRFRDQPWEETDILTPAECTELRTDGHLTVQSTTHRNRIYRVPCRAYSQVEIWEGRQHQRHEASLCLQPANSGLDAPEWVATQKVLILADEERYLRTANHFERGARYNVAQYYGALPSERFLAPVEEYEVNDDEQ